MLQEGAVQQLYSVQCPSGSSLTVNQVASIQCLNVPAGGAGCENNPGISLSAALQQVQVSKKGGWEGGRGGGRVIEVVQ